MNWTSYLALIGRSNKGGQIGGICGIEGERRNARRAFVRKLEGKRSLGIPGSRWEDREIGLESVPGLPWLPIGIIGCVQFP